MIQIYQESTPFTNKRVDSPVSSNTFLNPIIMPFALNTTLGTNVVETVFYIKNNSVEHFYNDVVISLMREDSNLTTSLTSGIISQDKTKFNINSYVNIPVSLAFGVQAASGTNWTPKTLSGKYQHNYVPITECYSPTNTFYGNTSVGSSIIRGISHSGLDLSVGDKIYGASFPTGTVITEIAGVYTAADIQRATDQMNGVVPFTSEFDFDNNFIIDSADVAQVVSDQKIITVSNEALVTQSTVAFNTTRSSDKDIRVKFSYGYDQLSDYDWSKLNNILVIPYIGNSTTPDMSYIPIRMRIEWLNSPSIYTIQKYFLDVSYSTEGAVS